MNQRFSASHLIVLVCCVVVVGLLLLTTRCGKNQVVVQWEPTPPNSASAEPCTLKVYVENSGSMNGYMHAGTQLTDVLYDYVSLLGTSVDTVELNYLNSEVVAYPHDLKHFIETLTPAAFRAVKGNKSNSDIAQMLDTILSRTDANTISLFVSDCILDVKQGATANYLVNRQIDIRNTFRKKLNQQHDLATVVLPLTSTFTGYYYYDRGSEYLQEAGRPYYLWLIGPQSLLARCNRLHPWSNLLTDKQRFLTFVTPVAEIPYTITNQFGKTTAGRCVCRPDRRGRYQFQLQADLSGTLQDDGLLLNPTYYRKAGQLLQIDAIRPIQDTHSPYTHILTLSVAENVTPYGEKIELGVAPFPAWVEEINDDSGADIQSHMTKTTGIKYILQGVDEAYKGYTSLGSIPFTINKQ